MYLNIIWAILWFCSNGQSILLIQPHLYGIVHTYFKARLFRAVTSSNTSLYCVQSLCIVYIQYLPIIFYVK